MAGWGRGTWRPCVCVCGGVGGCVSPNPRDGKGLTALPRSTLSKDETCLTAATALAGPVGSCSAAGAVETVSL